MREVPYLKDEVCDNCGEIGAFDFMGDLFCQDCIGGYIEGEDFQEGDYIESEGQSCLLGNPFPEPE
jgi:hypothetical protein